MFLVLHLNSRLQPKHRFELEDALTEIFESNDNVGKITGGGTAMFPSGEIESCDIEIEFSNRSEDFEWLLNLLDNIGIPKGSVVKTGGKDFSVGSLEGLGLYLNGCDLPQEIYEICDVNELIGQLENSLGETGPRWCGAPRAAAGSTSHSASYPSAAKSRMTISIPQESRPRTFSMMA